MRTPDVFTKTKNALKKFAALAIAVATVMSAVPVQASAAEAVTVSDIFVSETDYATAMESVVEPYIEQYKQSGYVTGKENASLYYEKYVKEDAKGTVVISHGFTESLEKYDEMIYYFLNMGYSVYGMEHRGHSRSGRLGTDGSQVNVETFSYYMQDLKTFLDQVVVPEAGKDNLFLFGHSMGGGIATRFLELYPGYFEAAILSAPMLEVNSGSIPSWFAKLLSHGLAITPYADQYILGQGAYDAAYDFAGSCTTSESRYAWAWQTRVNNPILQMGGGSYRWLSESYYATCLATTKCQAQKVTIPVILFQAGNDTMVGNDGQNTFAKYAKNCTIIRYENAKHEMYAEADEILFDYLTNVFNFLGEN